MNTTQPRHSQTPLPGLTATTGRPPRPSPSSAPGGWAGRWPPTWPAAASHVRVWNRTASRAEALAADGAVVATSPAEAARGATIVITMLADGPATEQAATGPDGLLAAARDDLGADGHRRSRVDDPARRPRRRARGGVRRCPGLRQRGPGPGRPAGHPGQRPRSGQGRPGPGVRRARARHRLAGPGGQRHPGQAGAQQLARRPHRDDRGNPVLRPAAGPGPGRDRGPAAVEPARRARTRCKRPAACWPETSARRSRSSTRSRTPSSPRRPRRRAAPRSRSPARCYRAGGTPPPSGHADDDLAAVYLTA